MESSLALYSCAILYNYYDLKVENCYESKMSKKEYIIIKLALKHEVIFKKQNIFLSNMSALAYKCMQA